MIPTILADIINTNTLIVSIASLACLFSVYVLFRSQSKVVDLQKQMIKLQHDLRVAHGSAIGMGQQLIHLEKQVQQQKQHAGSPTRTEEKRFPSQVTPAKPSIVKSHDMVEESSYDRARQSLAKGMALSDVAEECGLSHAEVSLLQSLSKHSIHSAL